MGGGGGGMSHVDLINHKKGNCRYYVEFEIIMLPFGF